MLNELQKQYSQELNNFAKWKQELDFRKTLLGKIGNAVGKITAVVFMIKFYNGVWNALYTSDQWEYQRKNVYVKLILNVTGQYKEEDELYWMIIE